MRKLIAAPCLLTAFAASGIMAQGLPGNPIRQAGQAVQRANDSVQNTIRDGANRVENRVRGTANQTRTLRDRVNPRLNGSNNARTQLNQSGQSATVLGQTSNQANVAGQNIGVNGDVNANAYTPQYSASDQYSSNPTGSYNNQDQMSSEYPNQAPLEGASEYGYGTAQPIASNQSYRLMHDGTGREFICVNGQRVYFDNVAPQQAASQSERYQAGYGSYDSEDQQLNSNGISGQTQPMQNQSETADRDLAPATSTDANIGTDSAEAAVNADANARLDRDGVKAETELDATATTSDPTSTSTLQSDAKATADTQLNADTQADASLKSTEKARATGAADADTKLESDAGELDADAEGTVEGDVDLNQ